MATITDHDGLDIVANPTGDAGQALTDNFKKLAMHKAASNPGTGDNSADGYGIGSRWLNTSTNKLNLTLMLSSGTFSGSAEPPGSGRSIRFKGALRQNRGYGYFLDAGQSGWVLLQP